MQCQMQGHSAVLQQHLQQQPMLTLNMGPNLPAHLAQQLPNAQATEVHRHTLVACIRHVDG